MSIIRIWLFSTVNDPPIATEHINWKKKKSRLTPFLKKRFNFCSYHLFHIVMKFVFDRFKSPITNHRTTVSYRINNGETGPTDDWHERHLPVGRSLIIVYTALYLYNHVWSYNDPIMDALNQCNITPHRNLIIIYAACRYTLNTAAVWLVQLNRPYVSLVIVIIFDVNNNLFRGNANRSTSVRTHSHGR